MHGALGSREQFDGLELLLTADFKVYPLNFSGHGRRPSHHHSFTIQNFAHEVLDWMNEHYVNQADIFGYSMGGYVALWLARFYPERIGKIFTLGTKLRWSEAEAEAEIKMLNPEKVVEKVPAFAQSLAEMHGEHEWKSVMTKTASLMKDLGRTHLSAQDFLKISQPVLLGLGAEDNMVTQEETEQVHRLLKNSELKIYPNVLHPIEKVPVELLEAEIKRFLK